MSTLGAIERLFSLPVVERLGWTLMHSLWQLALVLLLALAIVRAMRRSSANGRYFVLVVAMILSTLAPIATWLLLPTPPLEQAGSRDMSATGQFDRAERFPTDEMPGSHFAEDSSFEQRPGNLAGSDPSAHSPTSPVAQESTNSPGFALSLLNRVRSALRPWLGWMVAGWSLGVVLCSLRPLLGWRTLRRLRRLATSSVSSEVSDVARRLSRQLGLRRTVHVLSSTLAQVPVVFGYLRPVILLPVSLVTSVPIRQLEAILAHELAHVRRHDFALNLLQTSVETLFFYHPAIWRLSRRIRIEREHCCDDLAVKLLGNPVEYGRALLAIEELRGRSSVLALGAGGSSLLSRIRRLATPGSDRNVASSADRWSAALLGFAVIVVTCFLTMYRTVDAEDGAGEGRTGNPATIASDTRTGGVAANAEPARLRIRNVDGSAAQVDEVVEATIGFPNVNIGFGSHVRIVGNNNADTSYSGILSGPGSLTKIGTGSLHLSGTNTYTGSTVVNAGTLAIGASGLPATLSGINELDINNDAISSPGGWVGYATREGIVSLEKLSAGTHWLLAGGSIGRPMPFQVKMPAEQPILEQRLRGNRNWARNDIEMKTAVQADDKAGDDIVILIQNKTRNMLTVSEQDVQIMAATKDEPIRGVSPKWRAADFGPIKIDPGKSGELRLNWREWAKQGLWSTRVHEVLTEPTLPRPDHGKIWVRVCIDNRGPDLLTAGSDLVAVADPKDIASDPEKKTAAVAPAAEEYQSATYLQKKLSAKIPDAAWGKARDGLRLALVVRDANNTEWNYLPAATSIPSELKVRLGDEVRCQLVVENVGDHGVNFSAYYLSEVGRNVNVLNRAGGKADIQTTFLSSRLDGLKIPAIAGHWRLLSGERFLLQMPPIHFVDKQPEEGDGYFVTTSPGEYTLQCGYTLGDLSADAIKPAARTAEWTGELATGALKVTVSDSPEPDRKGPTNQLDPDSARPVEDPARETPTKPSDANAAPQPDADTKAREGAANGEIVGRLIDSATGTPVAGATIACGALINDSGKGGGANAVTDAQGRYRLAVPSPGIYNVWLKKFDKDPLMTAAADDGIRVEADKVATSQLFLVVGRKVAGKVVDSAGKTFANMHVMCYSSARPHSGGVQSVTTKADGTFEFALPPGRAQIYVMEASEKHPDNPFAFSRSADAYIDVLAEREISPLTLTLEASQTNFGDPKWLKRSTPGTQILRHEGNQDVTGTVVGEDGQPIDGAKVFPEDGPIVLTNEKGEFRVATKKGTQFVMHAVAPGYHAWFGTPTSGDVLKIVLESKQPPRAERGALPPARNPGDAAAPARTDPADPAARD